MQIFEKDHSSLGNIFNSSFFLGCCQDSDSPIIPQGLESKVNGNGEAEERECSRQTFLTAQCGSAILWPFSTPEEAAFTTEKGPNHKSP